MREITHHAVAKLMHGYWSHALFSQFGKELAQSRLRVSRYVYSPVEGALSQSNSVGPLLDRGRRLLGRSCAELLAGGAIWREQDPQLSDDARAKLDNIASFEKKRQLLTSLRIGRPDVVLVDTYLFSTIPFDWLSWAKSDPEIELN